MRTRVRQPKYYLRNALFAYIYICESVILLYVPNTRRSWSVHCFISFYVPNNIYQQYSQQTAICEQVMQVVNKGVYASTQIDYRLVYCLIVHAPVLSTSTRIGKRGIILYSPSVCLSWTPPMGAPPPTKPEPPPQQEVFAPLPYLLPAPAKPAE